MAVNQIFGSIHWLKLFDPTSIYDDLQPYMGFMTPYDSGAHEITTQKMYYVITSSSFWSKLRR